MPTSPIKIMGKAKAPSFFKGEGGSSKSKTSPLKRNMPVLLAIVLLGVALILYLRSRSTVVQTGPALTTAGVTSSDQTQIDTLTAAILAHSGQVTINPSSPSGGASTPITPTPVSSGNSTPGGGTPSSGGALPPGYSGLSKSDQTYWAAHLTGKIGPDTYDPATLLARWQQQAQNGPGAGFTQQDINTGLAYAQARASAAGVTSEQLSNAHANVAAEYAGTLPWGQSGIPGSYTAYDQAVLQVQGLVPAPNAIAPAATAIKPFTLEQINWLNRQSVAGADQATLIQSSAFKALG
jgi:hypothetical protein